MKIDKILENDNENKEFTAVSAYAIVSLISNRIDDHKIDDKFIVDEFFGIFGYDNKNDNCITIADNFVKNNFSEYHPDIENTQEIQPIKL